MTDKEKTAIRCAFADLCGSLQAMQQGDMHIHDWREHKRTIAEMAECFDFVDKTPEDCQ